MLWANNALPEAFWHRPRPKLSCHSQRQEEAHISHTLLRADSPTHASWLVCCDHRHQWLTHVASMPFRPKICPHMAICVWREGVWLSRGRRRGGKAMIKSNTERIRSDVTQAVRAESTPCGMQKPSAEKLYVPQKKFPTIPQPHPHLCLPSHNHCSLESTDILYIPACSLCVCVCVCGERATKPDGCLVWFRLEPSVISAAEVVSCHALATLPNHLKHLNSTLIGLSLQLVCPDTWERSAIIVCQLASHRLSYFCNYSASSLIA